MQPLQAMPQLFLKALANALLPQLRAGVRCGLAPGVLPSAAALRSARSAVSRPHGGTGRSSSNSSSRGSGAGKSASVAEQWHMIALHSAAVAVKVRVLRSWVTGLQTRRQGSSGGQDGAAEGAGFGDDGAGGGRHGGPGAQWLPLWGVAKEDVGAEEWEQLQLVSARGTYKQGLGLRRQL